MKKKREEKILLKSSSCRNTTTPENHHSKSIGCMSGIFHFVSKYHHRRKFITSGEKKDKTVISSSPVKQEIATTTTSPSDSDFGTFSCNVKRSPTITSEIRQSSSTNTSENSPAVMRFDEIPPSPSPESVAEKRRKLMDSLQNCEEDLKSLKKMIEAVRSTDHIRSSKVKGGESPEIRKECLIVGFDGGDLTKQEKKCSDYNSEQPSPVSVLEDISSSPSSIYRRSNLPANGYTNFSFFHRITLEALPRLSNRREDKHIEYISSTTSTTRTSLVSPFWSSKAKEESVNEVCEDAVWEERWELGRIAVVLEDYMFRDLIEEIVTELGCCCMYSLPFEACKRRLNF